MPDFKVGRHDAVILGSRRATEVAGIFKKQMKDALEEHKHTLPHLIEDTVCAVAEDLASNFFKEDEDEKRYYQFMREAGCAMED